MATQKTFGFIPKQDQTEIYTDGGQICIAQTSDDGSGEHHIIHIAPANVMDLITALKDAAADFSEQAQ